MNLILRDTVPSNQHFQSLINYLRQYTQLEEYKYTYSMPFQEKDKE